MTKRDSKIIILIILSIFFFLQSPLWRNLDQFFQYHRIFSYPIWQLVFYFALPICILICFRKYSSFGTLLKILLPCFTYTFLATSVTFSTTFAFIFEVLEPLIIFAIILIPFFLIAKTKITFNRKFIILVGIITSLRLILSITFYALEEYKWAMIKIPFPGHTDFLYTSDLSDVLSILILLCFYTIVFLTLNLIIDSTPEPPSKEEEEEIIDESKVPEGMWICRGCGKLNPESNPICECGYKRIFNEQI